MTKEETQAGSQTPKHTSLKTGSVWLQSALQLHSQVYGKPLDTEDKGSSNRLFARCQKNKPASELPLPHTHSSLDKWLAVSAAGTLGHAI